MSVEKNIIPDTQDINEVSIDAMFTNLDDKTREGCEKQEEIMYCFSGLNKEETRKFNNIILKYLTVETTV